MTLKTLLFISCALSCLNLLSFSQNQASLDSLTAVLEGMPEDTHRVRQLTLIAGKYIERADYIKALPFAKEGDALATRLRDTLGHLDARNHLALCQTYLGDYDKALENYLFILKYWEEKQDFSNIARYYSIIGQIHDGQNQTDQALAAFQKSLKFWKYKGSYAQIAYALWNLGGISKKRCEKAIELNDTDNANLYYSEAIAFIEEAYTLVEGAKDTLLMAYYSDNLGFVSDIGNYGSEEQVSKAVRIIKADRSHQAFSLHQKAASLYQSQKDTLGVISTLRTLGMYLRNRGVIAEENGDLQKAAEYFKYSVDYFLRSYEGIHKKGFPHGMAFSNKDLGEAYLKSGNFQLAEKHLLQAVEIFKKIGFRTGLVETLASLSKVYEQKGDFQNALDYYKLYIIQKDSLANEESLKNRDLLIARYESDSKAREIELLKKDKEISDAKARRQRVQNLAVGAGALLIGAISILSLALLRSRRKREKMELTQQLHEVRQEALKAQISDHFIANSMQSINRFVESNNPGEASKYLLQFSRLIRRVLENSADKSRALAPLAEDLRFLQDYVGLERLRYKEQNLALHLSVDPGIDTETTMVPPMVLQILAENAIKHGLPDLSRGGEIRIRISQKEPGGHLTCSVEDNGAGRQAATAQSQRPARGTQLAGRLIALAQEAGEEAHFQIEDLKDENGQPAGTRVSFQFPFISSI